MIYQCDEYLKAIFKVDGVELSEYEVYTVYIVKIN